MFNPSERFTLVKSDVEQSLKKKAFLVNKTLPQYLLCVSGLMAMDTDTCFEFRSSDLDFT